MRRLLVLAALLVACRDAAAPASGEHPGDYLLRSVRGHPLPQIIATSQQGHESIVGGVVVLDAGGTFVDSTHLQIVGELGVSTRHDVARGTYRLAGDSVVFEFQGGRYAMFRNGVELVQDFAGVELVYRR